MSIYVLYVHLCFTYKKAKMFFSPKELRFPPLREILSLLIMRDKVYFCGIQISELLKYLQWTVQLIWLFA